MADISKISPDDGSTILNIKDSNAVHWGDQSKGYVGKNKLPNHATNQSGNGTLTVTVNADKSITVNGTPSSTANIELLSTGETIVLDSASKLSGCPSGGSGTTYLLQVYDGTNWTNDYGNGNNLVASTIQRALVQVRANVTVNNLTFKPMITDANVPNSDYAHYEPYLTPNTEIDNKFSYADNAILGAKNLLPHRIKSGTKNNISINVGTDGSITLSNTANANTSINTKLTTDEINVLLGKKWIFTTGGIPYDAQTANITFYYNKDNTRIYVKDGEIADFTDTTKTYTEFYFGWWIPNGVTPTNATCYPMLRLSSDTDDTYVPYSLSNKDITRQIRSFYAKFIDIPKNGSITITAAETYQQFFAFGQRNTAFLFWNYTSSASGVPLVTSADIPTVTYVENKVTRLTNNADASMSYLIMSYFDFTIS